VNICLQVLAIWVPGTRSVGL